MKISRLLVENCRNVAKAEFEPDPELTVIAGENGQGKTNLLECVFLLTGGKSFRGARDMDLVRRGQARGKVEGFCEAEGREKNIQIVIEGPEGGRRGRYATINGVDYGRASAIAGQFTAVVFEPGHLSLVKGGPEGRRRFLDAALCQLYPGFVAMIRRFNRALSQKNALLKKYYDAQDADYLLDAFDAELAASGAEICKRREAYLKIAGPAAERLYGELASDAEHMRIEYKRCNEEESLDKILQKYRINDIRAGFSTAGPQREDFEVFLDGQSARVFGSQGQQRSAVLSLKLAEAEAAHAVTGEHPVLLLDDVLSELDEGRQNYLLGKMNGKQCIVTTCDPAAFARTAGKTVFVRGGAVENAAPGLN